MGTEVFQTNLQVVISNQQRKTLGISTIIYTGPDSSRCQGLSRTRDGIVIAEADLNLCQQVKDSWVFQMTARYDDYAKLLTDYCKPDFTPQVVKDPSLSD